MKLLIASDIHGDAAATEKLLAAYEREKAELLLLCGDYLYHGPRNNLPPGYAPQTVVSLLERCADKIIGARGNCDSEVDQLLLGFPMMSDYALVVREGRQFFLTHGHIYSPRTLAREENPAPRLHPGSVFVFGHTHVSVLEYLPGGEVLLVNPGSVSLPKGGTRAGYAVISEEAACLKTLEGETLTEERLRF